MTGQEMRRLEATAIESGAVSGAELMERAGQAVCTAIFERWPHFAETSYRAVIMCGPGNNGGDGFVIARLFRQRGWQVTTVFYGNPEGLKGDAKGAYQAWLDSGGTLDRIIPLDESVLSQPDWDSATYDLAIDAIFGSGLKRGLRFKPVINQGQMYRGSHRPLVSVDMPTGVDINTGAAGPNGYATHADLTVTFHGPKVGHYLGSGPSYCGTLAVKSIGLERWENVVAAGPVMTELVGPPTGVIKSNQTAHKYTHGHCLVFAGGPGKGGAARLAARGGVADWGRFGNSGLPLRCTARKCSPSHSGYADRYRHGSRSRNCSWRYAHQQSVFGAWLGRRERDARIGQSGAHRWAARGFGCRCVDCFFRCA
jgi:hydroxyethylthiazole kinase-like uncharacterized protein yjeF